MVTKILTLVSVFALVTQTIATAAPTAADFPQRKIKKIAHVKRQEDMLDTLKVGTSCGAITGNPDDKICSVSKESIACAPVCCMRKGVFVDGCPSGDKCMFDDDDGLRCCPPGDECGPRPTACANFGKATKMGEVMCPSATPSCVTRDDGGAACSGTENSPKETAQAPASVTDEASVEDTNQRKPQAEPTTMPTAEPENQESEEESTTKGRPSQILYPGESSSEAESAPGTTSEMPSSESMRNSMTVTVSVSESVVTGSSIADPQSRTSTGDSSATNVPGGSNSGGSGHNNGKGSQLFGLLVAIAVAFGGFL